MNTTTLPVSSHTPAVSNDSDRPTMVRMSNVPSEDFVSWTGLAAIDPDSGEMSMGSRQLSRIPKLVPRTELSNESFVLLEKWDGVVTKVDSDSFVARLFADSGDELPKQAVFSKEELSSDERQRVEEGAPFVWTIGYRNIGSTRHRDSVLYFRRLPPWEESEIQEGLDRGKRLIESISWE